MRKNKTAYYLDIAKKVAARSTCLRRQYGAVIVKDDGIIATGYNGAPRGEDNCCDIGQCWREAHNIPHGEQYEKCVAVHAEQNAIISASRSKMIGSTLYLVGIENGAVIDAVPCDICRRLIANAGISYVMGSKKGDVRLREHLSGCGTGGRELRTERQSAVRISCDHGCHRYGS